MRLRSTWIVVALSSALLCPAFALVRGSGFAGLSVATPAEIRAYHAAAKNTTAYTLPPGKLRQAVALNRIDQSLTIFGPLWTLLQLILILSLGTAARMRDLAQRLAASRWLQGTLFVFFLLLLTSLLDLPLGIYAHHVGRAYGLSVQGWSGWLADRAKLFALEGAVGSLLAVVVFWIMRRSPTRWWFWLWIPAVIVSIAGLFVTPYVIDPLFNKFEPLARANPALVVQLEKVVARSGIAIPPERIFLMRASAKYTGLNAYVTGFGASKRIVVWDTTIAGSSPDEIAYIFAHELGHYALGHVLAGATLTCLALLPFFWLGYHGTRLLLHRFGPAWRVASQQDWAALPVLLLVLFAISILAEPIANAFSRSIEHAADIYGQEAVHGIIPDPRTAAVHSFQVLGEVSLDDPTPHPVFDWWFATHPRIRYRTAFAAAYDPWASGMAPKYFSR